MVGTGLIGGSIALALRHRGWHVSGLDADAERLAEAVENGVIDAAGDDLEAAEVVFVATPAAAVSGVVAELLAVRGPAGRCRGDRRQWGQDGHRARRPTILASSAGIPWPVRSRSV